MSFKKITQFEDGNFNEWENLFREFFPRVENTVRSILLPTLDDTLDSMLGIDVEGVKKSINVQQCIENQDISGVNITVVYNTDEFHVETAPQTAIEQDNEAIKSVLVKAGLHVDTVSIDTSCGDVVVIINIPVKEEDITEKNEQIPQENVVENEESDDEGLLDN